tara:strand:+ start:1695 stop:2540 length:846 start_codon:yes stop_codon:yes gene_type:complete
MVFNKIRSYAKINLALNITGKTSSLHKIESLITFASLHDEILIKKIKSKKHTIKFFGKFSNKIGKNNTVFKLFKILEKKKLLQNKKFSIKINKKIPNKAGLGGGSMNAASIIKYFIKKKIIKTTKKEIFEICRLIGSDVILGLNSTNSILTSKNEIKYFKNNKKFHILIVKPNFGCITQEIYSKVKKFHKPNFNQPNKKMFGIDFLKKTRNQLEPIVFSKYPKLKLIDLYLKNVSNPIFVRMTGSGSALVAYYRSKEKSVNAKNKFNKKYKNYWCIVSKTI